MVKKLTTEEFINKAREVHGNKYDYSKVKYIDAHTKVCIICPKHGEFWQTPNKHLNRRGCPKCGGTTKLNTIEFINKAREVHGEKYDYSKVEYVDSQTKVCIVCPEHGEFWQTPSMHLNGNGCPKCAGNIKLNTSDFIKKAREVHGEKYDYSKVEYVDSQTKVCIVCPEHGEFWQTPNNHLNGKGCHKCGIESRKESRSSTEEDFTNRAREVHGDKYDYSKVKYVNANTKVCIICPKHGEFWQTPNKHLNGRGCPKCGGTTKLNTNEFINKARETHGSKYDYSKVKYLDSKTKVCIICPQHGEFWQTPAAHLNGQGCPNCQGIRKKYKFNLLQEFKSEMEFRDFLDNSDIDILYIILRNMKKIDPKFDPITADIEKALKNIKSKDPIKALEEKYSKDEGDEDTDETYDDNKDDDNAVDEAVDAKENEKVENTNTQPTIEDAVKHTEKEIKVISKIYPMLTPEDREYIKKKYLNDKLRYWMADREVSK